MQPTPSRHDPDPPDVPAAVIDEIFRVTRMTERVGIFYFPFAIDLMMTIADYRTPDVAPRWTASVRDELREVRAMLRRSRAQVKQLSADARAFLCRCGDHDDRPSRYIIRDEIGCISDFEAAALALETKIEHLDATLRPKRGDQSKRTNKDEFGAFYDFAASLSREILARGGRITVDKTTGRGSLITVLRLLMPYLPDRNLPGFVTSERSTEGLHRLEQVRDGMRDHARRAASREG